MNKCVVIFIVLTVLAISLSGCVTLRNRIDDIDVKNVSSINIYDLRESSDHESGFYEKIAPVYTLEETIFNDFFDTLDEIVFTDTLILLPVAADPSFYYSSWVVRINFSDGSYRFISCGGYGESFDSSGNITNRNHYGCDYDEWEQFIVKYLPVELYNT